jgi:hypothetical protein
MAAKLLECHANAAQNKVKVSRIRHPDFSCQRAIFNPPSSKCLPHKERQYLPCAKLIKLLSCEHFFGDLTGPFMCHGFLSIT